MFASKNHWDFRKISSELWYADELKTLERYLPIKIVKIEDVESKFIHDLSCKTGYPYIRDRKQLGVKVPKKV
jgi:hypothetical protein